MRLYIDRKKLRKQKLAKLRDEIEWDDSDDDISITQVQAIEDDT